MVIPQWEEKLIICLRFHNPCNIERGIIYTQGNSGKRLLIALLLGREISDHLPVLYLLSFQVVCDDYYYFMIQTSTAVKNPSDVLVTRTYLGLLNLRGQHF